MISITQSMALELIKHRHQRQRHRARRDRHADVGRRSTHCSQSMRTGRSARRSAWSEKPFRMAGWACRRTSPAQQCSSRAPTRLHPSADPQRRWRQLDELIGARRFAAGQSVPNTVTRLLDPERRPRLRLVLLNQPRPSRAGASRGAAARSEPSPPSGHGGSSCRRPVALPLPTACLRHGAQLLALARLGRISILHPVAVRPGLIDRAIRLQRQSTR